MAKLFIVRHGQASFGEADYDRLSDLGRQQSRWLGEYFTQRGINFRLVATGGLSRQRDTASEILDVMGDADAVTNVYPGLNEYDSEAFYTAYTGKGEQHRHQSADYKDYWKTFRAAYEAWIDQRLTGVQESWSDFRDRIRSALDQACAGSGRDDAILAVTSGGVIGSAVSEILESAPRTAMQLNFQIRNTAFCEVIAGRGGRRLLSFNSIPHLDRPGRRDAITHV